MARKAGICEATTDEVSNNADDDAYDQVRHPGSGVAKGLFTLNINVNAAKYNRVTPKLIPESLYCFQSAQYRYRYCIIVLC